MRGRVGYATRLLMIALFAVGAHATFGQSVTDTIRVMNYNLTNYGNYTSYCTTTNNPVSGKDPNIEKVIAYFQPHIFGVNEMGNNNLLVQRVKALSLNTSGRTWYEGAFGSNINGSDIVNAFFWDTRKIGLAAHYGVPSQTRDIDIFKVYHKPVQDNDTVFLHVIIVHLKAGNTASDASGRAAMITTLRTYLANNLPNMGRAIFMGDLNVYSSNEACYQLLVNPAAGVAFRDPINRPGSWSSNSSFASIHTQSTRVSSNGCLSGGGMDDRFDQILMTDSLLNSLGTGPKMYFAPGTYKAIGQDGNRYNSTVNSGTNSSVPADVANALFNASDHLPISCKLIVDGLTSTRTDRSWPTTLNVRANHPNEIRIENADLLNPVTGMEIFSMDGRKLESLNLKPVQSQTATLSSAADACQVLLVRITTSRSTYTKRLLLPRG